MNNKGKQKFENELNEIHDKKIQGTHIKSRANWTW